MEGTSYMTKHYAHYPIPHTPVGIQAIYNACRRLYPDQPNPLQVTAVLKYWLGGPDPLDYISMYANPGNPDANIPPHWHYVTFGLSDLHGDGRVHEFTGHEGPSGFGFELTFRLKREDGETAPPTWPAALMQALARYVFQSENTLCVGDHIPWHSPLDGSESRIQHMLMTEDPQLNPLNTQFGSLIFVQVVGVCAEELRAAQHWNGIGVLDLMKTINVAGDSWLITDMRRGETIFEIDPHLQDQVDEGIEREGSNLSGVTSQCSWEEYSSCDIGTSKYDEDKENRAANESRSKNDNDKPHISLFESEQIKATLKRGLRETRPVLPPIKSLDNNIQEFQQDHQNKNRSRKQSFDSNISSEAPTDLLRTRTLDGVQLRFNQEAAILLPLALKGRLKHGRHFTFKSVLSDTAITFVSSSVVGSFTDEQNPYAAHGPWLQVLLTDDYIEQMLEDLSELSASPDEIQVPKTYSWTDRKLSITIVMDES
ncbi:hypothetical protein LSH36_516g01015 [Paralvinella palmiformis]|uniref:Suppressor of fused homolog n=1 Tax=Paralvinella palmiformis TaxID=53620 RepID=A0AAD9J9C5_9ANNE|nr:hypothetical protein LSH36_516g01015 [Paralvinella palmiformis]